MKINRKAATPIYQQVANYLRDKIYSEEWGKGQQIPSENEIMNLLEVSRGTVKKAINSVVAEGLLEKIQGKGTYVTEATISYPLGLGLMSFAESLESQKLDYKTEVLQIEYRKANKDIATKLKINVDDEYLYLKRLRYVDEKPVMVIENHLNHKLCPNLDKYDYEKESLFRVIEVVTNKTISHSESRYAARLIGQERGNLLRVSENTPTLHLEQIVYLEENSPVDFGNVWLKGNQYYLGTILQRGNLNWH